MRSRKPRPRSAIKARGPGFRPAPSRAGLWHYVSRSAADTARLGRALGKSLGGGEVLALYGELGSGKTAFARGIASGLGAPPRDVSSPTFVLVHEYQGRMRMVHMDLYRLKSDAELSQLGLADYLDGRSIVAVEWADKAGAELPHDCLEIHLHHAGPGSRDIVIQPTGPRSRDWFARAAESWKTGPSARTAIVKRRRRP
jgi:tRNA threonylcarbamoyladenosine biosynthesis protein TsaE